MTAQSTGQYRNYKCGLLGQNIYQVYLIGTESSLLVKDRLNLLHSYRLGLMMGTAVTCTHHHIVTSSRVVSRSVDTTGKGMTGAAKTAVATHTRGGNSSLS